MAKAKEIWKEIPGYDGFEASSLGRIRVKRRTISVDDSRHTHRTYPRRILAQQISKGYFWVSIRGKTTYVHRLILLAFAGPRPFTGAQGNHKNGVKKDNSPKNLEWCSPKENVDHAISLGLRKKKLSFEDAVTIRFFYASKRGNAGATQKILAKIFDVTPSVISRVGRGFSLYQKDLFPNA